MSNKYTPSYHYQKVLTSYQGNNKIDLEIINLIKQRMLYYKINEKNVNATNIKLILRELYLQKHYQDIPSIIKILTPDNNDNTLIETYECPVCLDSFSNNIDIIILECNHKFCKNCVKEIKKNNNIRCPLCRRDQILSISGNNELTIKEINQLLLDFEEFNKIYDNYKPTDLIKINHLPFNYILYKLLEKNKIIHNMDISSFSHIDIYDQEWMFIHKKNEK